MKAKDVLNELKRYSDPVRAKSALWFFKTGKGEYGEGDKFLGVTVPNTRKLAKQFYALDLKETDGLLRSPVHEARLLALFILVQKFDKGNDALKKKIYDLYLSRTKYVNNWDLVDSSAPKIIGAFLFGKNLKILEKLAVSDNLWERRISIISTFYFINQGDNRETLKIAKILRDDSHDLIHKAVGWMLREVGNRCSIKAEESYLLKNYRKMPRTMLRYAIEKFPEARRRAYLSGII